MLTDFKKGICFNFIILSQRQVYINGAMGQVITYQTLIEKFDEKTQQSVGISMKNELMALFMLCKPENVPKHTEFIDYLAHENAQTPLEDFREVPMQLVFAQQTEIGRLCHSVKLNFASVSTARTQMPTRIRSIFNRWEYRSLRNELANNFEPLGVRLHTSYELASRSFKHQMNLLSQHTQRFTRAGEILRQYFNSLDDDSVSDELMPNLITYASHQTAVLKQLKHTNTVLNQYSLQRDRWAQLLMSVESPN